MQRDDHEHINIVYHILRKDIVSYMYQWVFTVDNVLQLLGFLDDWKYQTVGNSQLFLV